MWKPVFFSNEFQFNFSPAPVDLRPRNLQYAHLRQVYTSFRQQNFCIHELAREDEYLLGHDAQARNYQECLFHQHFTILIFGDPSFLARDCSKTWGKVAAFLSNHTARSRFKSNIVFTTCIPIFSILRRQLVSVAGDKRTSVQRIIEWLQEWGRYLGSSWSHSGGRNAQRGIHSVTIVQKTWIVFENVIW